MLRHPGFRSPTLPDIPERILARPDVQRCVIALLYEALREVWQERHRAQVGSPERYDDHRLLRSLIADLRRRRRRLAIGASASVRQLNQRRRTSAG